MNFREIFRSEFFRNTMTLMTGTTIAQAVNFLLSPFLTRLYTPEDFGMLATFMAITGILGSISSLRYEMAIMLPKEEKNAVNLLALATITCVFFALLTLAAVYIIFDLVESGLFSELDNGLNYLLPLSVLLTGAIQIFNFWSFRLKFFRLNAMARIANSAGNISIGIALGYLLNLGGAGLIIAYVGSMFLNLGILLVKPFANLNEYIRSLSGKKVKEQAIEYKKFPLINTVHTLIGAFRDSGIVFVLKDLFGQRILGSYSFAYRILTIPTGVISSSISQVFYQKATELNHQKKSIRPLLVSIYKTSILIGLPIFGLLFFLAPDLFAFIFSEDYRQSGEIARYLLPWIYINFVASSASALPLVYNKLLVPMLFGISDFALQVLAVLIGWYFKSWELAFIMMGILCFLNTFVSFIWLFAIIKKADLKIRNEQPLP